MTSGRQRNIVLILARDLASRLATAVFLVDHEGDVIYFNEVAERLLGRRFVEGEEMPPQVWSTAFKPTDESGRPLPLEELSLGIAIQRQEPSHQSLRIEGADGVPHAIEATAFPLFAHEGDLVGALAIFWERPEDG